MSGSNRLREKVRVTLDLTPELNDRLERLTELTGASSKSEVVRAGLRLLEYMAGRHHDGYEFLQRKGDRVEIIPIFEVL
jgi:Arc/MetJ-type ribon-helix-helix transcriptional regulator